MADQHRGRMVKELVGIGLAVALGLYFWEVTLSIGLAAVMKLVGAPLVEALHRVRVRGRGIPRSVGAAVALIAIWMLVALFFFLLVPLTYRQLQKLGAADFSSFRGEVQGLVGLLDRLSRAYLPGAWQAGRILEAFTSWLVGMLDVGAALRALGRTGSWVWRVVVMVVSMTFIGYFFLREPGLITRGVKFLFPSYRREAVGRAIGRVRTMLHRYLVGVMVESLVVGGGTMLLLWIFRMPTGMVLAVGVVAGVVNVAPYVGPVVSVCVALLFGISSWASGSVEWSLPWTIAISWGSYAVFNLLDSLVVQPVLFSNSTRSHPLEVFLVMLAAGSMGGVLAIVAAVPTYTAARIFVRGVWGDWVRAWRRS